MIDRTFWGWVKLMFSTLLLPLLITLAGAVYLAELGENMRFREAETVASEKLEAMRLAAETEKYICNEISEKFNSSQDARELELNVKKLLSEHGLAETFLIWDENGKVSFSGLRVFDSEGDWHAAWRDMKRISRREFGNHEKNIPVEILQNVRRVFGIHFFPRYYHMGFTGRRLQLLRNDAKQETPLSWLNFSDRFSLLVHIDYQAIKNPFGLHRFVEKDEDSLASGYIYNDRVVCRNQKLAEVIRNDIPRLSESMKSFDENSEFFIFKNFISRNITGFCAVEKRVLKRQSIGWSMKMILLLLLIMVLFFALMSYQSLVLKTKTAIGIRKQLILLFLVSNAIPGYVLAVFSTDYLNQLKISLINNAFNLSMSYLQSVDEHYASELTFQKQNLTEAYPQLIKSLKKNRINKNSIRGFLKKQSPQPYRMFLVASSTGIVAGRAGIVRNGKVLEGFEKGFKNDSVRINTKEAIRKVSEFIMASLNKTSVTSKQGTEVEYIVDSLLQVKPEEMIGWYLERQTFIKWGIGLKKHPTFTDHLKLFSSGLYDYLLTYMWDSDDLELQFIRRIFHGLNRNEYGLQIMAIDERMNSAFPEELHQNRRLKDFALKLRDRSLIRPEFLDLDGEKFMLVGYKCILMETIRLLALYPMANIESEVNDRQNLLLALFVLSILVSVSLSLFVASGILQPMAELQKGMQALRERRFSNRLPNLGRDEFGNLARIFNEMLVDLEELQVAATVQEKLMTTMDQPLRVGCFDIYGQMMSLSELGGDYFDIIETSDSSVLIVIGEVVGKSVGTCLMLSFIKSATMQLNDCNSEPVKFFDKLEHLICRGSRSDQTKAVKLSGVVVSGDGRLEIIGNGLAGISKINQVSKEIAKISIYENSIDEIAVAPSFSDQGKGKRVSKSILMASEDSLVCYTSGTVTNCESSVDHLPDIVADAMSENAKTFCGNIFSGYFKTVDKNSCSQDMTMLVISKRKNNNGTENS